MTDAEKWLWSKLRDGQIKTLQFRKQVPIGPFVVDFCCLKAQLVIEVDGGQHDERSATDERRTAWLNANGYRVLRFWNNEVLGNTEGVLDVICRAVESSESETDTGPHPYPPPNRGRGK